MTNDPTPIHESVRKHYGEIAQSASSCCGDSSCCESGLYNSDLLAALPEDIAGFSLGCGDPISGARLQPGEVVVDLGSGGGLDCFLAARQVGASGRVIGVDMTPQMLEKATAAAERMGLRNVEFRKGYLEALPVDPATVDVVISNCVINLSPDKEQVFREMFRVLKPGGRISVSDILMDGVFPKEMQEDPTSWAACVSGAVSAAEYAGGLVKAGFVDVKITPKGQGDAALALAPADVPYSAWITAVKPLKN